jgi:hypothetical protein
MCAHLQVLYFYAMRSVLIVLFLFGIKPAIGQFYTDSIVRLKSPITESSGLLYINNTIITHNDSGNDAVLYEIDTLTGLPQRTVYISNASNTDWEDLALDSNYIYIGDFGNNQGTRQNLRIYKVALADYWQHDTVTAEVINFSYADQSSYSPMPFQTDYDAEALISVGNSLYIFTKQWGTTGTRIYEVPKMPGNYNPYPSDSLALSTGFVTGATITQDLSNQMLALLLNTLNGPKITVLYNQSGGSFSNWVTVRSGLINVYGSIQVEGITWKVGGAQLFVSSEELAGITGMLSNVLIPFDLAEHDLKKTRVYPVPSSDFLVIDFGSTDAITAQLMDNTGRVIFTKPCAEKSELRLQLPDAAGIYVLRIDFKSGSSEYHRVVKCN